MLSGILFAIILITFLAGVVSLLTLVILTIFTRGKTPRKSKVKTFLAYDCVAFIGSFILAILLAPAEDKPASEQVTLPTAQQETVTDAEDSSKSGLVTVTITSDPTGARVYVPGASDTSEVTPFTFETPANEPVSYTIYEEKERFEGYEGSLTPSKDETISVWLERFDVPPKYTGTYLGKMIVYTKRGPNLPALMSINYDSNEFCLLRIEARDCEEGKAYRVGGDFFAKWNFENDPIYELSKSGEEVAYRGVNKIFLSAYVFIDELNINIIAGELSYVGNVDPRKALSLLDSLPQTTSTVAPQHNDVTNTAQPWTPPLIESGSANWIEEMARRER